MRVISEERRPTTRSYQVLVPIANPQTASRLVGVASAIARRHDGELLLVSVATVPVQTPLDEGERYVGDRRALLRDAMRYVPHDIPAHRTVVGRGVEAS